ncbi:hypothetical protein G6F62_015408 [Rhizopus arrhizus]|nr:hypothetical protein G6F62_015408 [Rhizopus arrhizus]
MPVGQYDFVLAGRELAALHRFAQKAGRLPAPLFGQRGAGVVGAQFEAGAGHDDRDSRSHGAASDDAYGLDGVHGLLLGQKAAADER